MMLAWSCWGSWPKKRKPERQRYEVESGGVLMVLRVLGPGMQARFPAFPGHACHVLVFFHLQRLNSEPKFSHLSDLVNGV